MLPVGFRRKTGEGLFSLFSIVVNQPYKMPLNVIVVGAGLGGLGAAIALNRAGHNVQVIEKSGFLNEVGAATHVAPNATRILKSWGCELDSLQPVHCEKLQVWDAMGDLIVSPIIAEHYRRTLNIQDEWVLAHRVDLHNALRTTAAEVVDGRRVEIRLSSRVASVDAEAGEVLLENGTKSAADLIVGADGIHSRTVNAIAGAKNDTISTGQNCFRFLVPVDKMRANPSTDNLLTKIGLDGCHVFTTKDRRLVVYPCRGGELLNVAGICPSNSETDTKDSSWHDAGSIHQLLDTFSAFGDDLKEMCRMAEDVKLWSLASRDPAPTFIQGKLALIGDAAHPMLPHQGQGAAQALEDAAALAGVMTADTTTEQIPRRLDLYNKLRYSHAVTVMMMSRTSDDRRHEMADELRRFVPDAEIPADMVAFTWPSDPMSDAAEVVGLVAGGL
ncbi:hypothetical protein BJX61DRAFT_507589 [Aspergillus egyptiacus]|nr:hypothetical protein BJX61DRAFT_507589 [Aspergillus egyptiacus]